jgi:4-amino-4-deoxy-L-arabinose transferase-like glycosyltransferase
MDAKETRRWAIASALLTVLMLGMTLGWSELSSGSENLVVATSVETRRDGNWLLPTLDSEPRVRKPPLVAWMTALVIPESLVARMEDVSIGDDGTFTRDRAYVELAWRVRIPVLIAIALVLGCTYRLGRIMSPGDARVAMVAMWAVASGYLMLRFGRNVTTDIWLTAWVAATHVAIAEAILRGRRSMGIAGVLIGLGFMTKGPVVLVFTVLPWMCWHVMGRRDGRVSMLRWLWVLPGFLIVGLSWFVYVATSVEGVIEIWTREVSRVGATGNAGDSPLKYLLFPFYVAPWTVLLLVGLIDGLKRYRSRTWLWAIAVVLPIVVMSFAPDRKDRYLLPLIIPAAILVGHAVRLILQKGEDVERVDVMVKRLHAVMTGLAGVGLGAAGLFMLKRVDGEPWFGVGVAIALGFIGLAAGVLIWRGHAMRIVRWCGVTFVLMLVVQVVVARGYAMSREGKSEMKPLAELILCWREDAKIYQIAGSYAPPDLNIYANRSVYWIDSVDDIPSDGRSVVVMHQSHREATIAAPEGFRSIGWVWRDRNRWWAFVRE